MHTNLGEAGAARARCAIRVHGVVQGVGFRPAVYRMARRARLGGFVRNDAEGVWIEVEGEDGALRAFADSLVREAPPLARIDGVDVARIAPLGERDFRVVESATGGRTTASVPVDVATCDACLRELFDPLDRRHRYPFINCTECGPRFTIVCGVPYDRANTTMAGFVMCAACRAEYEDPADRRFHAEPNACGDCGPVAELVARGRAVARGDAAVGAAIERLASGGVVALKGLGGYQLAVDAANRGAIERLRARKRRPRKPLALMARDASVVDAIAVAGDGAREVLGAPARPIVLLAARPGVLATLDVVAPGLREVGVMLPAAPLHHLLLAGLPLLVVTSGNRSDEPIAKDDAEALSTLADVADAFLVHDRPIHTRADDSVVRLVAGAPQPVRRARGFVPEGVALAHGGPSIIAVGAQLKNTICVTRGAVAYPSQHVGDLDCPDGRAFFEEVAGKLRALLGVAPEAVAHDLHPDYASTRWALASGLPRVAVQHHHAHVAACMAEHGRAGPVVGVAFDGTGCGPAGELWGGEILLADLGGFRRLGALRPVALPGGEAAIREPWRLAVAVLHDAGERLDLLADVDRRRLDAVVGLIESGLASPRATGAGRWFDAVSAIVARCRVATYEGEAAVALEALAGSEPDAGPYPLAIDAPDGGAFVVDLRPAVRALAAEVRAGEHAGRVAARFHATLAEAARLGCLRARRDHGVATAALSGGCFQNRLLSERCKQLLEADGFEVLLHRRVPPNDGGVSLGQAAVAAFRMRAQKGK